MAVSFPSQSTIVLGPDVIQGQDVDALLAYPADVQPLTVEVADPGTPNEGLCVAVLGALARFNRHGASIRLLLPELVHAAAASEGLLSTLLVLYSDAALFAGDTGDETGDIRNELLRVLEASRGAVSAASSAALLATNLPGTEPYPGLRLPALFTSKGHFSGREALTNAMAPLLERFQLTLTEVQNDQILTFTQQAVDNTREHGYITPNGDRIPGVRCVRFRVLLKDEVLRAAAPLGHYLERLSGGDASSHFLEIYVGDPGRGIAATIHNDDTVYEGPIGIEQARFTLALSPGGTRNPRKPGAGRGLVMMTRATHELRAFMAIRTGRLLRCRHFLDPMGRLEPETFDETDMTFYRTYDWDESVSPRIDGTHVFCLVPVSQR